MAELFIEKAKQAHGDKYDYSKVDYINNLKEVIIICQIHGEFMQLPKTHKRGSGCKKCGLLKVSSSKKSNNNKFINGAKLIHGNKYDYSKVEYIKSNQNVIIICPTHGEFLQKPNGHLSNKAGCTKCSTQINSDKQRKTTEQFIIDAKQIHGNKYDYSKVDYNNVHNKVIIICPTHGDFLQSPNSHLGKKSICPKCSGCYKSNTEEFIEKSEQIHGNKYDYSKVDYKTVSDKVIIICPTHGDFIQTPNSHLNGAGCQKCGSKMHIFTNSDFIEKAKIIHGDKYDYSKVDYTKMGEKVIIICPIHREFEQMPSNHITHKQGCPICAGHYLSNTEEFIEKSIKKHGDKYDYSKVDYVKSCKNVIITCLVHGNFEQTPNAHLSGHGCVNCGIESMKIIRKTDIENFINNSNIIHNNKYDYSKVNYINARTKIIIICPIHGEFEQVPDSHLRGTNCKKCMGYYLSNTEEFIDKSIKIYGDKYDYSKVEYIKSDQKITIICKKHNYKFDQTPSNHLFGYCGCRKCNVIGYSKAQILWLNFIEMYYNIHISHAENDGEYTIPTTKYKADGYCKETNTIYEYHGSYWHGDPNIYDKNEINKVNKKTFGELYANTQKKEQLIKDMGYNLVVMWEINWIKINMSISILQNKFRKKYI